MSGAIANPAELRQHGRNRDLKVGDEDFPKRSNLQSLGGMERWSPSPPLPLCLGAATLIAVIAAIGGGGVELTILLFCVSAALTALAWRILARRVHHDFILPLTESCHVAELLRQGQSFNRLPEHGAAPLRLLSRRLNAALAAALDRDRRSSAQLLSAEISLDRAHSVLQSLTEGVVVVDVMGEVVLANTAAEQILDSPEEDLTGMNVASLLRGDLAQAVAEGLIEAEENP